MKREKLALLLTMFILTSISSFAGNFITVHYKTTWGNAYLHYKSDSNDWTAVPGKKMEDSSLYQGYKAYSVLANTLEFVPNDGSGNWDHIGGGNYFINSPGDYLLENGIITKMPDKPIIIHFKTNYATTYIHYKVNNGDWTQTPGLKMGLSSKYFGYTYYSNLANRMEFVLNDGNNNWAHNSSGGNFVITTPGEYVIEDGVITSVPQKPITLHYYTGWDPAYLHFKSDNRAWTTLPGIKMDTSSKYMGYKEISVLASRLEFVATNGSGVWDKAPGNVNYVISNTGEYVLENGLISNVPADFIKIHYKTNWSAPYIQYKENNKTWTIPNGIKMKDSAKYTGYKYFEIPANTIEFVITNGSGIWDKKNGNSNYYIGASGEYLLEDGNITSATKKKFQIHYNSAWEKTYIHYNLDGKGWTVEPGILMEDSQIYFGYKTIDLEGNNCKFVFTDGNANWDNNSNIDYYIDSEGVVKVDSGGMHKVSNYGVEENDLVAFYYRTDWDSVYLTYDSDFFSKIEDKMIQFDDVKGYKYYVIPNTKKVTNL